MISSQNFVQQNARKYRAKVEFKRVYNTDTHEWKYFYSHEQQQTLITFLESIEKTIGKTLVCSLSNMAYELYEFYYRAPNIVVRKYGDEITLFYDERKSRKA